MANLFVFVVFAIILQAIPSEQQNRVMRGEDANITDYPYMVALYHGYESMPEYTDYSCAAVLLTDEWALSSAGCITFWLSFLTDEVYIAAGIESVLNFTALPEDQIRSMEGFILHEDYNATYRQYDVGLIKISPPFELSDVIQPATLSNPFSEVPTYSTCTTVGWGKVSRMGLGYDIPDVLQKSNVTVISDTECDRINEYYDVDEYMICAGDGQLENGQLEKNACSGDEGGPLVCDDVVAGIATILGLCGRFPAHIQTSYFIDWIQDSITSGELSTRPTVFPPETTTPMFDEDGFWWNIFV